MKNKDKKGKASAKTDAVNNKKKTSGKVPGAVINPKPLSYEEIEEKISDIADEWASTIGKAIIRVLVCFSERCSHAEIPQLSIDEIRDYYSTHGYDRLVSLLAMDAVYDWDNVANCDIEGPCTTLNYAFRELQEACGSNVNFDLEGYNLKLTPVEDAIKAKYPKEELLKDKTIAYYEMLDSQNSWDFIEAGVRFCESLCEQAMEIIKNIPMTAIDTSINNALSSLSAIDDAGNLDEENLIRGVWERQSKDDDLELSLSRKVVDSCVSEVINDAYNYEILNESGLGTLMEVTERWGNAHNHGFFCYADKGAFILMKFNGIYQHLQKRIVDRFDALYPDFLKKYENVSFKEFFERVKSIEDLISNPIV